MSFRILVLLVAQSASSQEPPAVKYTVAAIALAATLGAAIVAGIFAVLGNRALERLKADLSASNSSDLERLKSELQEQTQRKLEKMKSSLSLDNQKKLEALRAQLGDQSRAKNAKLDYRYEAHKRLYRECEPLLFQLAEFSQNALYRIYSLARSARRGSLPNWLESDDYYKRSTMYFLVAPLAILRLIQRRLTFVDLTLDDHIASQYALLKLLYLTFTDAFDFARATPELEYEPDAPTWEKERVDKESKYWQQGLYIGTLDNTIDALLRDDGSMWRTFGEFENAHKDKSHHVHKSFMTLSDVLNGFHPRSRPVLWRMLVAQTLIYERILQAPTSASSEPRIAFGGVSPHIPKGSLDWRRSDDTNTEEDAVLQPMRVAEDYLAKRMSRVFGSASAQDIDGKSKAQAAQPGIAPDVASLRG